MLLEDVLNNYAPKFLLVFETFCFVLVESREKRWHEICLLWCQAEAQGREETNIYQVHTELQGLEID